MCVAARLFHQTILFSFFSYFNYDEELTGLTRIYVYRDHERIRLCCFSLTNPLKYIIQSVHHTTDMDGQWHVLPYVWSDGIFSF